MTLPQETQQMIANRSAAYADHMHAHEGDDIHIGYMAGATEYAIKLHQVEQEISELKAIAGKWKELDIKTSTTNQVNKGDLELFKNDPFIIEIGILAAKAFGLI